MGKRTDFTITLIDGPTVSEQALRCFLQLEKDGINVSLDPNGVDLILNPPDRVAALNYVKRLPKYKPELLLLTRYVLSREAASADVHADDVRWKSA